MNDRITRVLAAAFDRPLPPIASQDYRFPITSAELAALIRGVPHGEPVHTTLARAGHGYLIWTKGQPMPAAVNLLAKLRGVFAENADGAGI